MAKLDNDWRELRKNWKEKCPYCKGKNLRKSDKSAMCRGCRKKSQR